MTIDSSTLSAEEIRRRMADFEWYHRIDLGHGIYTPGVYDLEPMHEYYGIPDTLAGRTVLDVGPGDGYFAFEFERRGAAAVATAELPSWTQHDMHPALKADAASRREAIDHYQGSFGFALQARQSRVERKFCNIYDLAPDNVGTYDVVFCASVLLHLTDPLRALYALRRVCRGEAIICTGIDTHLLVAQQSRALFVGTPNGQAFWLPTMTCLEQMALAAGFVTIERVATFKLRSVDGRYETPHGTIRARTS